MENGVPLTSGGLGSLHVTTYFHGVEAIGGRLYAYDREAEPVPGYIVGWSVNNITFEGGLDIIMECVSDIHNANCGVVSGRDSENKTKCRCF